MKYIELFSGCGGLSLGLKSAGFNLLLANELSPMASETFAYNFFGEDLAKEAPILFKYSNELKTVWLSSNFTTNYMQQRLREDPRTFPEYGTGICDFSSAETLKGKLLVANIIHLNKWLEEKKDDLVIIKNSFGEGSIDLVSGGPPCQSFSLAGMRDFSNHRNTLPWEFAKFVKNTRPKIALLENVTGILRAFKVNGKSYYAWFEVAKAFAQIGYVPLCLHINAKYVSVAQNRPRFILLSIREDIYNILSNDFNKYEKLLFKHANKFYSDIKSGKQPKYGALPYFDINRVDDSTLFKYSFLRHLKNNSNITTVSEAINDLRSENKHTSSHVNKINRIFKSHIKKTGVDNHEYRKNSERVKRRFRIYQILNNVSKETKNEVANLIKGKTKELTFISSNEMLKYSYLFSDGNFRRLQNKKELENYISLHQTKKQTQRALIATKPAPTTLSIPDDACHYHSTELRTLTVREMARIQSFPDNFIFKSKITTGGKMRQFEVPQYTQVGNAVPPLLGRALGFMVKELIERLHQYDNPSNNFIPIKKEDNFISTNTFS